MKKKRGFTLVELLSVIVILAIILAIAIPKVLNVMTNAKLGSIETTTKVLADAAQKQLAINKALGNYEEEYRCEDLVALSKNEYDYSNCEVKFVNDKAFITIRGIGRLDGYMCIEGTKEEPNCTKDGKFILTVNLNGGTIEDNPQGRYEPREEIVLAIPTKEGSTFLEWSVYGKDASIDENNVLTMGKGNTTITAVWNAYPKLTVNLDGGNSNQDYPDVYAPGAPLELETPTKDGYTFDKWQVSGIDAEIIENTLMMGTGDTTITANWIKKINPVLSYQCSNAQSGSSSYEFMYTGKCTVIDDGNGNWRVRLLSNGDVTVSEDSIVDIFLVGGGGGGANGTGSASSGCGAGGGGYTTNVKNITLSSSEIYSVTIGTGGGGGCATGSSVTSASSGNPSKFVTPQTTYQAAGGIKGSGKNGGNGGNGGGGFVGYRTSNFCGYPSSWDGIKYGNSFTEGSYGGTGQGTTTCEFGEGTLSGCNTGYSNFGEGGVTAGADSSCSSNSGKENTGKGGNSNPNSQSGTRRCGCPGMSGIVIIRNTR